MALTLRRFLVVQALMLWQGGFLFYTSAVVPTGTNLLGAAGQALDTQKRKSLYTQIERLLSDDGPSIIPTFNVFVVPMRAHVQGFNPTPDTFYYYKTAWLSS